MKKKINSKILFCAPHIWKKVFLYQRNPFFKISEKYIYDRSSIIPLTFTKCDVFIYNGKIWQTRFLNKWMVGFKMGEFTWNKKVALYKAKQLKKLKKKKK